MWSLITLIGAILGAIAFFRLFKQTDRIDALEAKVKELMAIKGIQDQTKLSADAHDVWTDSVVGQAPAVVQLPKVSVPVLSKSPPKPATTNLSFTSPVTKSLHSDRANQFFTWLKENWAGFLGVSILVLGITFGTVYLSLFASPIVRFLILIVVGLLFLGAALMLQRYPPWRELSSWLRGGSGAIILYSVLATAFIPALHFYQSPITGFVLLCGGLFYNVVLAYFASKEIFASFHVLISLIALMVAPKEVSVLLAASVVAFAGIGLSVRQAWNINLTISFVSFSIFHILWIQSQSGLAQVALIGVICGCMVGISALLAHYQKIYQQSKDQNNLFVHITIWLFLGGQLALYNLGFKYLFIPLGIATIACFSLSLYAKRKNIHWLFSTDALVGQLLATLTLFSLSRIQLNTEIIAWLIFVETLSYTTLTYWLVQRHLSKVGAVLMGFAYVWLCIALVDLAAVKIMVIAVMSLIPLYLVRYLLVDKSQDEDVFETFAGFYPAFIDFLFFALAFLALLMAISLYPFGYMSFIAVSMLLAFNDKLMNQVNHKLAYLVFATLTVVFSWSMMNIAPTTTSGLLFCGLPPFALFAVLLKQKSFYIENDVCFEDLWVYLLGIHVGVICMLLLWPVSAFLPGVSFLIAGILFFEIALLLNNKSQDLRAYIISIACKNMAVVYLLGYSLLYMLLYLPSEMTLFSFASVSQVLTLVAICTSIYWYFSKPILPDRFDEYSQRLSVRALTVSQAITFDIAFVLSIFLLVSTFSAPIHPIGYACLGLLLSAPLWQNSLPVRARIYALGLLMATCTQVAIVSSKWASPLSDWYHDTHVTGPISLVLALVIASFLLKSPPEKENKLLKLYYQSPVLMGLLPIFIALGLFLMWRFDKAYLTMLWVIEIVVIVATGFILKNKHLVHLALLFLIFCVGRLLFYDLAQTALIVKAMVFMVVGALMILIHIIYKKYASRLE